MTQLVNRGAGSHKRVGRIYRRSAASRGAQIIFCDLATPKGRGGESASKGGGTA
jgi:hypothetical protein